MGLKDFHKFILFTKINRWNLRFNTFLLGYINPTFLLQTSTTLPTFLSLLPSPKVLSLSISALMTFGLYPQSSHNICFTHSLISLSASQATFTHSFSPPQLSENGDQQEYSFGICPLIQGSVLPSPFLFLHCNCL